MRTRSYAWLMAIVLGCSCELFVGICRLNRRRRPPARDRRPDRSDCTLPGRPDRTGSGRFDEPRRSAGLQQLAQTEHDLKGSELQEAASKANFDAAFIALSLFPDVIQMMAEEDRILVRIPMKKIACSDQMRMKIRVSEAGSFMLTDRST